MSGRGWLSKTLPLVGNDERLWTAAEAALHLDTPDWPVSVVDARRMAQRLTPVGKRRTAGAGRAGRCARAYRAADFVAAYEAQIDKHAQSFQTAG